MAASVRRKVARKAALGRCPLSLSSLQMMVQSGIVRRADMSPPEMGQRQCHVMENVDQNLTNDATMEQGWLSRIVRRRRSHSLFSKRSGIR